MAERGGMNDDYSDLPVSGAVVGVPLFSEQEAQVAAAIVEHFGCPADEVNRDASFVEDLEADSLDMVELTVLLEERFNICIGDAEAAAVTTVADAFRLVAEKKA